MRIVIYMLKLPGIPWLGYTDSELLQACCQPWCLDYLVHCFVIDGAKLVYLWVIDCGELLDAKYAWETWWLKQFAVFRNWNWHNIANLCCLAWILLQWPIGVVLALFVLSPTFFSHLWCFGALGATLYVLFNLFTT